MKQNEEKVELNLDLQLAKARVLSIQLREGSVQLEYYLPMCSARWVFLLNREPLKVLDKTY